MSTQKKIEKINDLSLSVGARRLALFYVRKTAKQKKPSPITITHSSLRRVFGCGRTTIKRWERELRARKLVSVKYITPGSKYPSGKIARNGGRLVTLTV